MGNAEARNQLQKLSVEIDPTDGRSPEEILLFIQQLAARDAVS